MRGFISPVALDHSLHLHHFKFISQQQTQQETNQSCVHAGHCGFPVFGPWGEDSPRFACLCSQLLDHSHCSHASMCFKFTSILRCSIHVKKKIKKKNPDTNIIHVFEMLKVLFDFWKIICSHKDCGATFLKLEWTLSLLSVCTGTAADIPLGETCIQTPSCTQGTSEHPMQWQISFRLSGWCVGSFCTWKIKINPKYRKPVKIY